jgi:hypothetical protein
MDARMGLQMSFAPEGLATFVAAKASDTLMMEQDVLLQ